MKTPILALFCCLSSALLASGQVPSLINYQGRLTDANGAAVTGNKNFSINIFDAATGGNLLYSETIGAVTLDSNGVYSFQFGSAGTSNKQVTETIGTTVGTTLVYSKALANSSVVNNSITVTDGTNSWSQSVGNPGAGATATANTIVGFVIGATITNGGSGYTSAPEVTISGNGTGATATATLTDGVVTGINITSAGSGYTTGVTITIAPPVIPFRVEYSSGTITATYASAPTAGRTIAATYRYGANGLSGMLANNGEMWLAITVDGTTQTARQRVLPVPYALYANKVNEANLHVPTSTLSKIIDDIAVFGVTSSSFYKTEDFPTGPAGRNNTVQTSSFEMTWDDPTDTITTRSLVRSESNKYNFDKTWPVNGAVDSLSIGTSFGELRNASRVQFIYFDASASGEIQLRNGNQIIGNPDPTKLVRNVRIWGWTFSGPAEPFSYSLTPNYTTTASRSVVIQLSNIESSTFGLRAMVNGSASQGKNLTNCLQWKVIFSDGSESDSTLIGQDILWNSAKVPQSVRISTIPLQLGEGSIDISRIVVRMITKN